MPQIALRDPEIVRGRGGSSSYHFAGSFPCVRAYWPFGLLAYCAGTVVRNSR